TRPYETVARAAPLWRDDPNYPGVPSETTPAEMLAAKTTHRATVDYDTYVLRYSARQRGHVLMIFAGIALAVGAIMLIQHETPLILALTAALGLIGGGGAGFLIAAAAHGTYTRDLAVSVSETYHPRRAPQPETVRPFVPSSD